MKLVGSAEAEVISRGSEFSRHVHVYDTLTLDSDLLVTPWR
jgi:hypothetical protein